MSNPRLELVTPQAKFGNQLLRYFWQPLQRLPSNIKLYLGVTFLTLATTLLIANPYTRSGGEQYKEGEILRQSIISPADIIIVDEAASEAAKEAVADAVRPIFLFEPNRSEQAVKSFRSLWNDLRRGTNSNTNTNSKTPLSALPNAHEQYAEFARWSAQRKYNNNDLELLTQILREAASGRIYTDAEGNVFQNEITLVDRLQPNQQSSISMPQSSMTALSMVKKRLRERINELNNFTPPEREIIYQTLESFVQPSVVFDSDATAQAKLEGQKSVAPVKVELKRGQVIAREGDTLNATMLAQIAAIQHYGQNTRQWNRFLGVLLIIGAFYWLSWKFIEHRTEIVRLTLSPHRTFALVGLSLLLETILMTVGFNLADFTARQNPGAPYNDPTLWSFLISFGSASLILAALIDIPIASMAGVLTALIAGIIAPRGYEITIFAFFSAAMAVYGISRYRTRQAITFAGLLIGLANIATAFALIWFTQKPFILNTVLLAVSCAFIGGIITATVAAALIPIVESVFGILSDVKLLELSNSDLPILGQLALRAPGTNQHSHAVAQLADDACRAIGANALLARIGALYHDIGKLAAPDYFVENQTGANPHDRLRPVQSAKIVISHVTYGQKLAKEMRLPPQIIDFIPQHHGNRTLHYFLKKAQSLSHDETEIDEADFRYPGPKPQTREAAVIMIADSCEAAARSLAHPSPENIRAIVNRIIDAILADDQLDECELNLRELTVIRETIIGSLMAIYHGRLEYIGFNPEKNLTSEIHQTNGNQRGIRYQNAADIPISKGGEVEDEAVERTFEPNRR